MPSDDAIAQIRGQLLSKLEGDTQLLKQLVLYHIVPGQVTIDNDRTYTTLDEGNLLRFNKYFNGRVSFLSSRLGLRVCYLNHRNDYKFTLKSSCSSIRLNRKLLAMH